MLVRNEFHLLGIITTWLVLLANGGFAQSDTVIASETLASNSSTPLSQSAEPIEPYLSPEFAVDCLPCKPFASSNDGITVSMLDSKSQLKIFGSLSALTVFSTDRPFAPGLPLFLFPASSFGLNSNTFDIHGRQSNIGAIFIGP